MRTTMLGRELLEPAAEVILGPSILGEKFLECARCDIGVESDGFETLFRQVGELPRT